MTDGCPICASGTPSTPDSREAGVPATDAVERGTTGAAPATQVATPLGPLRRLIENALIPPEYEDYLLVRRTDFEALAAIPAEPPNPWPVLEADPTFREGMARAAAEHERGEFTPVVHRAAR